MDPIITVFHKIIIPVFNNSMSGSVIGLVSFLVLVFIYFGFMVSLFHKGFGLIYKVPDELLRWFGGGGSQLGEFGGFAEKEGQRASAAVLGGALGSGTSNFLNSVGRQQLEKASKDQNDMNNLNAGLSKALSGMESLTNSKVGYEHSKGKGDDNGVLSYGSSARNAQESLKDMASGLHKGLNSDAFNSSYNGTGKESEDLRASVGALNSDIESQALSAINNLDGASDEVKGALNDKLSGLMSSGGVTGMSKENLADAMSGDFGFLASQDMGSDIKNGLNTTISSEDLSKASSAANLKSQSSPMEAFSSQSQALMSSAESGREIYKNASAPPAIRETAKESAIAAYSKLASLCTSVAESCENGSKNQAHYLDIAENFKQMADGSSSYWGNFTSNEINGKNNPSGQSAESDNVGV